MSVQTTAKPQVGRSCSIAVQRSDMPELRLAGTVVWSRQASGGWRDRSKPPPFDAGIRFHDMMSKTAAELVRFLEAGSFIGLDQRVAKRFRVKLQQPAIFTMDCTFKVRNIGRQGMLIEADPCPPVNSIVGLELHLNGRSCRLTGRVAHAVPAGEAPGARLSRVGVEFVDLPGPSRDMINTFITRHIE